MPDAPLVVLTDQSRADRFWSNVDRRAGGEACWPWKRAANGSGYGVHRSGANGISFTTMAHRVAWMLTSGSPIPTGAVVDHRCSVRLCCNPAHLRVVTQSENVRASSKHLAGDAEVIRVSPATIRTRNGRRMEIWREYLADGRVRQAGRSIQRS